MEVDAGTVSMVPRILDMKSSSCSAETTGLYALMDGVAGGGGRALGLDVSLPFFLAI